MVGVLFVSRGPALPSASAYWPKGVNRAQLYADPLAMFRNEFYARGFEGRADSRDRYRLGVGAILVLLPIRLTAGTAARLKIRHNIEY